MISTSKLFIDRNYLFVEIVCAIAPKHGINTGSQHPVDMASGFATGIRFEIAVQ
jgi:hypothetical protein